MEIKYGKQIVVVNYLLNIDPAFTFVRRGDLQKIGTKKRINNSSIFFFRIELGDILYMYVCVPTTKTRPDLSCICTCITLKTRLCVLHKTKVDFFFFIQFIFLHRKVYTCINTFKSCHTLKQNKDTNLLVRTVSFLGGLSSLSACIS